VWGGGVRLPTGSEVWGGSSPEIFFQIFYIKMVSSCILGSNLLRLAASEIRAAIVSAFWEL